MAFFFELNILEKQDIGDRIQNTEYRRQETGDRRQETGENQERKSKEAITFK